jgi:RNA polymerase sigma factor (sigma-70 family)
MGLSPFQSPFSDRFRVYLPGDDLAAREGMTLADGDTTADVRDLIERLRRGDASAREALLDRVYHRLRRIAAATFRKEFPRLHARHDLSSIVDEAWMRLKQALQHTQPESAEAFYSLMFLKVRQVLVDIARKQTRHDAREHQAAAGQSQESGGAALRDAADTTHDPARLALWTEIQEEIARLPDRQRLVFDFHYFAELPQAEIARLLDLHPKQVSRLWLAATEHLAQKLDGFGGLMP